MGKAVNEQSIYKLPHDQVGSSDEVDIPDTDGSGETDPNGDDLENNAGVDDAAIGYDVRGEDYVGVKISNGWNENTEITLNGATFEDAGMDDVAEDTAGQTISSGDTVFIPFNERYSYVEVVRTGGLASDPTSGNLKIVFASDRNG